ncbi:IS3 family transposase [Hathewaya massiliensis]
MLWYNNKRIHSALNYMTSVEYRLAKNDRIKVI